MSKQPIRAVIIGANGYGGVELIRLLLQHPQVELVAIVSRSDAGQVLNKVFPHLQSHLQSDSLVFQTQEQVNWSAVDVCFFATPHGVAQNQVAEILAKGIKVIDLSADFRLQDVALWQKWYGQTHNATELLSQAVYGLPEFARAAIKQASLIACPGCYPTSVQLGLLPFLQQAVLDTNVPIIIDSKSGVSGAGRAVKTEMLYCERDENFAPYASSGHRHAPEMEQQLSVMAKQAVSVIFTPHLLPIKRGILSSIYTKLNQPADLSVWWQILADYYQNEPFVHVLSLGEHPQIRSVAGSNFVHIGIAQIHPDYLSIFVAQDNMIKGAAGQAVQCMNLVFDLPEVTGLLQLPLL